MDYGPLTLAMLEAAAQEDWAAVDRIFAMRHAAAGGDVAAFAEWKPGTSPATGEQGWLSDGGLFRRDKPGSADEAEGGAKDHAERHEKETAELAGPTASPEQRAEVGSRYMRAKEAVYNFMYNKFNPALAGVGEFLKAVGDEPDDMRKFGYNPVSAGNEQQQIHDPLKAATGVSTHLAMSIGSKVLAKAFVWLKNRNKAAAGDAVKMAAADVSELAGLLAQLYDEVNKAAGVEAPPHDPAAVEQALAAAGVAPARAPAPAVVKLSEKEPAVVVSSGRPASGEVALPGKDGKALARLMRQTIDAGASTLRDLVRAALSTYTGDGELLDKRALARLQDALAATNTAAFLMGRGRVREMADRVTSVGDLSKFSHDVLLFADSPGVISTPEAAAEYFGGLVPSLGIDPQRVATEQRRKAFTLAATTNRVLTERVHRLVHEGLRENRGTADVVADITQALTAAGVSTRNPQYAEMVFRTNTQDSYQTGVYEEGRHPDVAELFPCWQYLGIDDERAGEDHRPHFGRFYPAKAPFAGVRGDRPFNCRCGMRWVDRFEWEDLAGRGAEMEKWR